MDGFLWHMNIGSTRGKSDWSGASKGFEPGGRSVGSRKLMWRMRIVLHLEMGVHDVYLQKQVRPLSLNQMLNV
jgi:hypothetical protein